MVNFSRRLKNELIPEWKDAYCDYDLLKRELENCTVKSNKFTRLMDGSPRLQSLQSLRAPSFRHLGSIARRLSGHFRHAVVMVHLRSCPDDNDADEELYETELLLDHSEGEIEHDKVFFARLDGQLNKVNQFYRKTEQMFYIKADELKEQLQKLVNLRKLLKEEQDCSFSGSLSEKASSNDKRDSVVVDMQLSSIVEQPSSVEESTKTPIKSIHPHVRDLAISVPQDSPSLLMGALMQRVMDDRSSHSRQSEGDVVLDNNFTKFDRKKIQYAEKTLQKACLELYIGLGYLKNFRSLNVTAFSKILKKYDKKTGRDAKYTYMKVVEDAYFHSSDKVLKMIDGLERKFTEVFANGNHKRGMALLRPVRKSASHRITFFLGLFTGCSFACLVAFFVLLDLKWIRNADESSDTARDLYLRAIYPLFSILAMVLLHLCLYGWNLYSWREKRVNYAFIFGLPPGTEIKYRELLVLAMGLATLVTATLLGHFIIYTVVTSSFQTAIMPFSILMIFLLLLVCPLNICYQSSRFFLLSSLKHVILAPFYKVVMVDFFLADQLTSQVYMLRNVEYVLCYSIFGHFQEENINQCTGDNLHFVIVAYVVSMVPYWWRFAQCIRRWIDERNPEHISNGVKYFSALVAAGIALTYHYQGTATWLALFIVVSAIVTAYQLYWDICKDWGLLCTKSKNYLLRDRLMLKNKNWYFASMVLNTILRFAWLQSVTRIEIFGIDRYFTDWFFASLEVVRRVHWNFYRLENEHLNNVGHFRATKAIPLPFIDADEDD